jgi:molybdopterin synthase catalytic subunit
MDYLKTRAPFWKSEERGEQKIWVEENAADAAAADRWITPARGRQAAE